MRILFCGLSGYPNNSNASMNRYISIAKLLASNNEIIFINRIPLGNRNEIEEKGEFKVVNVTNNKFRSHNFFKRNILKFVSPFFEFFKLLNLNREKKIDWVNVYSEYFGICLFYVIISKILKYKTVLHYVEFRSGIKSRNGLLKLNDSLFDKYCMFLFDRYIPISHFLNEHMKINNPDVESLIIPPICDFNYFKSLNCSFKKREKYFLYCGSTVYDEVIHFIIESFEKIKSDEDTKLYLVLNGKLDMGLKETIDKNSNRILLFQNLKYDKLICLYKNAICLLIPLRNNNQDSARFPQKICEYLASEKVIISTNIGEIKHFFKDMQNGLIASDYESNDFASKMEWALLNKNKLNNMAGESYEIGKKYFNIEVYKTGIEHFFVD